MDTNTVKMKIKDLIGEEKYNALLSIFKSEKFAEVEAKDGSMLVYEGDLAEGVAVFVVTAEGNKPVEDGVVELADGTLLECAGGVVTKVTKLGVAEKATEPTENKDEQKMEGLSPDVEKAIADYVTKVKDELQAQIDDLKAMFGAAKNDDINQKVDKAIEDLNKVLASNDKDASKFEVIDNKFKQVIDLVEQIANLPIAPAKEEKFEQKTKRQSAITNLADRISKLKTTN